MPFAAFFVAFLLLLCIPDGSRKLALCLLLGALAGLCAVHTHERPAGACPGKLRRAHRAADC